MSPLEKQVALLADAALQAHGLRLVLAHLVGGGRYLTLQVLAEKPDGSSPDMEQCTRASRTLAAQLDVADLIKSRYVLEVSSPGLERPLLSPADYVRFIGRNAKFTFTDKQTVNGQPLGSVTGRIENLTDDNILTLTPKEGKRDSQQTLSVPLEAIRNAHLSPSAEELELFMKKHPLPGEVINLSSQTDADADAESDMDADSATETTPLNS